MLVQLKGRTAELYQGWLALYERLTGKAPTYLERTQALFAAQDGNRPPWAIS
jgi:hypothetical protein